MRGGPFVSIASGVIPRVRRARLGSLHPLPEIGHTRLRASHTNALSRRIDSKVAEYRPKPRQTLVRRSQSSSPVSRRRFLARHSQSRRRMPGPGLRHTSARCGSPGPLHEIVVPRHLTTGSRLGIARPRDFVGSSRLIHEGSRFDRAYSLFDHVGLRFIRPLSRFSRARS